MEDSVSVIVCTNGRQVGLSRLYQALLRQFYRSFEVVLVVGPTRDGTHEIVAGWKKERQVKALYCEELNLSKSRNIGIAHAAGKLLAFIDDDAIPEPEWLEQLVEAFAEPSVGGAGGVVFDPSSLGYEFRFSLCDRFGTPNHRFEKAPVGYDFPLTACFPHFMGTNCIFRRDALVGIGGFDEEYEYYLDETDVCCRLVDAGFRLRQVDGASVHHKFQPNHLRDASQVTLTSYPILKNKLYFSLMNNKGHASTSEIVAHTAQFISRHRTQLAEKLAGGSVPPLCLEEFDADASRAWEVGFRRGLTGERRVRPPSYFSCPPPFLHFDPTAVAQRRSTLVLLAPTTVDRHVDTYELAQRLAAAGHTVRVIIAGGSPDGVDLEGGVWVHRRVAQSSPFTTSARHPLVPDAIWHASITISQELDRIARYRSLDVIEDASYEGLAIALLMSGRYALAVRLSANGFANPASNIERYLVEQARVLVAASPSIIDATEARLRLPIRQRAHVLPSDRESLAGYGTALLKALRRTDS